MLGPELPQAEHGEDGEAREQRADRGRRHPALGRALDDAVEQAAEAGHRQPGPDRVERLGVGVLGVRHQHPAADQRRQHEGHVDQEHRPPPEVLQQEAAGHRADGGAGAGEAGPDGDGLGPFVGREDVGEDRQRRRHDQGGADAHDGPEGGELPGGAAEGATEDQEAGGEGALAAEAVADGAGGEQQPGEHEAVGVDDPLQGAVAGVQLPHQRGQGHVEDRVPDHDDDEAEAEDDQRPPPLAVVVPLFHHRVPSKRDDTVSSRSGNPLSGTPIPATVRFAPARPKEAV